MMAVVLVLTVVMVVVVLVIVLVILKVFLDQLLYLNLTFSRHKGDKMLDVRMMVVLFWAGDSGGTEAGVVMDLIV